MILHPEWHFDEPNGTIGIGEWVPDIAYGWSPDIPIAMRVDTIVAPELADRIGGGHPVELELELIWNVPSARRRGRLDASTVEVSTGTAHLSITLEGELPLGAWERVEFHVRAIHLAGGHAPVGAMVWRSHTYTMDAEGSHQSFALIPAAFEEPVANKLWSVDVAPDDPAAALSDATQVLVDVALLERMGNGSDAFDPILGAVIAADAASTTLHHVRASNPSDELRDAPAGSIGAYARWAAEVSGTDLDADPFPERYDLNERIRSHLISLVSGARH